MLRIRIYNETGQTIDMPLADQSLELEAYMSAFNDELLHGEFSLPITAPASDSLRQFLGYPELFNTDPRLVTNDWRCDVMDGQLHALVDCRLKLISHSGQTRQSDIIYSFSILGPLSNYGKAIKGKSLRDLSLGGKYTIGAGVTCRRFAKEVMTNPGYQFLRQRFVFVPVINEDFFDTTRDDYNNENLAKNRLNNIVIGSSFGNGWDFGVESLTPGVIVPPGNSAFIDHRTVPFFKFIYILKRCFSEFGYNVNGTFFQHPDIDKWLIFNNCSLERYSVTNYEAGAELIPANHVPNIPISDFLVSIQNFFNLKIDVLENRQVIINYRDPNNQKQLVSIQNSIGSTYSDASQHRIKEHGYTLQFGSDSNDNYFSDRVKDPKDFKIVGEVTLASGIASLAITSPDNTMYVYVIAENYYYRYNEDSGKWDPFAEGLWEKKKGEGEIQWRTDMAPLCEGYEQDSSGVWFKSQLCAVRMTGGYYNSKFELIESDFGLRIFGFIEETAGIYTKKPRSFAHNYNDTGTKIASLSLSWKHPDGLFKQRWEKWVDMLSLSWQLQISMLIKTPDIARLKVADFIEIRGQYYILQQLQYNIPLRDAVMAKVLKV